MTPEEIKVWIGIISGMVALVVSAISYLRQPSKDNSVKIEDLSEGQQILVRRVDRMETQIENMPTKDDISDVRLALSDLRGTVSTTEEIVKTVRRATFDLNDWLRNQGK